MGKKVLILFAHPALEKSHVNKYLIEGINRIENVTFHDLYELYPDFDIDIQKEQELLTQHDVVCFMHPIYWYSTPAILKEWQDLVLEHGWAYGSAGNALANKYFQSIITTGGPQRAYDKTNPDRYSLLELLAPLIQTTRLCKMEFLTPYTIHGTLGIDEQRIKAEKESLHRFIQSLVKL
jgi:glutathione-regulated potassium-efflux system ancillary protein KefG